MTDNEIIKALKCCIEANCTQCRHNTEDGCTDAMMQDALEIITTQKAEVERLKKEIKKREEHYKMACSERNEFLDSLETAKAEAYKEFAEMAIDRVEKAKAKYQRLCKEQGEEMEEHMHIHFNGIIKIINNLLKEMIGE